MNNNKTWVEKRQLFYTDKCKIDSKTTLELKFVAIPSTSSLASYDDVQIKILISNQSSATTNRFCILLNLTQTMNLFYDVLFKPKDIINGIEQVVIYNHITNNNLEFSILKKDEVVIKTITDSTNNEIEITIPIGTYRAIHFIISEFIKNFVVLNNTFITQDIIARLSTDKYQAVNPDTSTGSYQKPERSKKKS